MPSEQNTKKSNEELRQKLIALVAEINEDQINQPANRREGDFYQTKQVFLGRMRTEKEHLRWYDKRRHRHMKIFLLDHYNRLNERKEISSIDELRTLRLDPVVKYPHVDWVHIACHAAVTGIDELRYEEAQAREPQTENQAAENPAGGYGKS